MHNKTKTKTKAIALAATATMIYNPVYAQFNEDDVIRLNRSQPIITRSMFPSNRRSDGDNINGPSLIRVPNFISRGNRVNRDANYYLYFGHHGGEYIRMAWAENVTGPYRLYDAGASVGDRGVLDDNRRRIDLDNGVGIQDNHISSPDVHVETSPNRIVMYFHAGGYRFNGRNINSQRSFVNTSSRGAEFRRRDTEPVVLGDSYFKVFEDNNTLYAMDNRGIPRRARSFNNPWRPTNGYYNGNSLASLWQQNNNDFYQDAIRDERNQSRSQRRLRHTGVRTAGREAQIFFTERGDNHEHIRVSRINLNVSSWNNWNPTYPGNELLRPVSGWEGGQFNRRNSEAGAAPENVSQLRDPDVFEDSDGSLYLLYSGRGEDAIGIAALDNNRQRVRRSVATHDAHTRAGNRSGSNFRNGDLEIQGGSGTNDRRSYLRFPEPNANRTIRAAVLRVYAENSGGGRIEVFRTSGFNEATIRRNNQPSQGSRLARVDMGPGSQWYEFDVTPHVEDARRQGRDVSFVIRGTSSGSRIRFTSSEGSSSRRPELKYMFRP